MTLDEAIIHCEEVAQTCENAECGAEHRQLAKWLRELKAYKNKGLSIKCEDIIDKHINRNGKL